MALAAVGQNIRTNKGRNVLHEEAMRILANNRSLRYESHLISIPSPSTDVALSAMTHTSPTCTCNRGALSVNGLIPRADRMLIKNRGTAMISFRLNDTSEDLLHLEDGENLDCDFVQISEIYFTNSSGVAQQVRIVLMG